MIKQIRLTLFHPNLKDFCRIFTFNCKDYKKILLRQCTAVYWESFASRCGDEGAREAEREESAEGVREKCSEATTAILTQRCRRGALFRLRVVCYRLISFSPDSRFAVERGRTNSLPFKATEE